MRCLSMWKAGLQNGLQYFVIGDVGANGIQALSKLLRNAA